VLCKDIIVDRELQAGRPLHGAAITNVVLQVHGRDSKDASLQAASRDLAHASVNLRAELRILHGETWLEIAMLHVCSRGMPGRGGACMRNASQPADGEGAQRS
jgi:hypothetical protein